MQECVIAAVVNWPKIKILQVFLFMGMN